jgi:hypothetical protein
MAPRLSGESLTPWLSVWVSPSVRALLIPTRSAICDRDLSSTVVHFDNQVRFLREILDADCTRCGLSDCGQMPHVPRNHSGSRLGGPRVLANMTAMNMPTITRSMLDLCSAPYEARRFAPPAHARGLRALTVPARSSGPGYYVMVGVVMMRSWTDLDR